VTASAACQATTDSAVESLWTGTPVSALSGKRASIVIRFRASQGSGYHEDTGKLN